jgi:hypothetical protein
MEVRKAALLAHCGNLHSFLVQVEFHRYLLQLRLARCPKGKGWLGRKLWKAKTFLSFCAGNTC